MFFFTSMSENIINKFYKPVIDDDLLKQIGMLFESPIPLLSNLCELNSKISDGSKTLLVLFSSKPLHIRLGSQVISKQKGIELFSCHVGGFNHIS